MKAYSLGGVMLRQRTRSAGLSGSSRVVVKRKTRLGQNGALFGTGSGGPPSSSPIVADDTPREKEGQSTSRTLVEELQRQLIDSSQAVSCQSESI